nr:THAP domain-containing protein 10-like [Misgurnus anguillicaudatus]
MPSSRKCILPGCDKTSSVSLFKFPKNHDIKKRWIKFVKSHLDRELTITTNTRLCSDHFTLDSFTNFRRRQMGFTDNPLLLVKGAEPTIYRPELHPPIPQTSGANISSACPPATQSLQIKRETEECPCDMQKVTREVGCQTDHFVGKRTVATQLSKEPLSNRKSTGSEATAAMTGFFLAQNEEKLCHEESCCGHSYFLHLQWSMVCLS